MGTYSHSLDAKGRLIIPARLREELGDSFILTKNPDGCLAAYPESEWKRFTEKLDMLPKISSEPARRLRRFYFGNSVVEETDKQGRVLIPAVLREYAALDKEITLVGIDDHVEIWNSDAWEKYNRDTDMNDMMFDLSGIEL